MDDGVVQRVFQEGGRDYESSSTSSVLQSLPLHASFDHGYYLLVKSIQELRQKKDGLVTVGIGGPSGSGKTSLAEKVASVIGCTIISMENYRDGVDEGNVLDSLDFDTLVQNLEDLTKGQDTMMPVFDYQQKKRIGSKAIKSSSSGVVVVDGTYALNARLRSLLDIRVAVVGGVHFSLLSKVRYDIGDSCSLDYLIDSIFPLFRKNIEPDLHHAQIRINNSFVSSFREAIYKLKCRSETPDRHSAFAFQENEAKTDNFIEMYLRPPSASEEARINDWIKVRQSGIRYYLSLGDQRIVDKNFIIRPKAEFEVGRMTLGGLLALGYNVVVSYKRASISVNIDSLSLSRETIDTLDETYMVLRGTNRKTVGAEALKLAINGPWITKSYLEMILERKGVPRLNTPPPISSTSVVTNQERMIAAPRPIRTTSNLVTRLEDLSQPWTRSPTKLKMEPVLAAWHFISSDTLHADSSVIDSSSFRDTIKLAPMPDSYDLDRGLLLSVQAIQALLENKGLPVVVGIGGPSGSGKTSLAHKMANIVGCEVVSLESYFKSEQVKDFKYDDFSSLDLSLLSKNIADIRNRRRTKAPIFDLETGARSGFKDLEVSEDCGVIIFEGVYALHPEIRKSLDLWIAVVGGVHSHLISRVQRDKSKVGCFLSQNEIMMTVFPMFQQHIEPHLVHAHLKIRNDFDPVLSPESSLFVLKTNKQVAYQDILKVLDPAKFCSSIQNFIDIYLRLPGIPTNGQFTESDCIRVRICEGRFAVLIREPIREGNFIIQPKVDFDISISTVAGLLNLGYQAVAYIEASAFIYQDGKILIEVDHLQGSPSPYLQIKGVDKDAVAAAGSMLKLDGSYTTKGSSSASESSQSREASPLEGIIEDMQSRIRRLERRHTINTVLWTFLMSALVGYSLYQRKRKEY
ncbi:P-loop containing nucleoside triphosphate hydrolases superfamily protein isoform 1 [Tripterygium wilfordii]|uniref:P-loop containing nucleoside triphosphate hydrolases superfamily protein isoform 1 n=1 Tax=Tripterygium wilfordii TaxID=458696 RepID=A0A7J7DZL0_TRIWF|nr:P-loop containing nucleoside triphosphate hydrolases superfamily protein isoform 1 [Tripterygium wilfordii]